MTPEEKEISRFKPKTDLKVEQKAYMNKFNDDFARLAHEIMMCVPVSADRSAAIRYLRLSLMQVNAAICHDWPEDK